MQVMTIMNILRSSSYWSEEFQEWPFHHKSRMMVPLYDDLSSLASKEQFLPSSYTK